MSRRKDSRYVGVVVNDVLPLELGNIPEVETVVPRWPVKLERILEPVEVVSLPRRLQAEGRNCRRRLLRRNEQIDG